MVKGCGGCADSARLGAVPRTSTWWENRAVREGVADCIVWNWCSTGSYSASSAYAGLLTGQSVVPGVRELWKAEPTKNVRFFGCLAIHGRCWTWDRYFWHGLLDSAKCALCLHGVEILDHLFLGSVFRCFVWFKVLRCCGWHLLAPAANDLLVTWWLRVRKVVAKGRHKGFHSLVLIII
jgi:hypothetical protein